MHRRCLALALCALFFAGAAFAAKDPAESRPARVLFRLSGMEKQIATIPAAMEQEFRQRESELPPAFREKLQTVVQDAFDVDAMQAEALAHLEKQLDEAKAKEALAWLRSPQGRRITELEEAASQPEAQAAMEAYAASFEASPPEPERVALVQRLDRAIRATELTTDILTSITLATARAILTANPGAGSVADLEAAMEAQAPMLQQASQAITLVSFLYTYRELPAAELTSYIEFLEAPAGQWYQRAAGDAFRIGLRGAVDRFEAGLAGIAGDLPAGAS